MYESKTTGKLNPDTVIELENKALDAKNARLSVEAQAEIDNSGGLLVSTKTSNTDNNSDGSDNSGSGGGSKSGITVGDIRDALTLKDGAKSIKGGAENIAKEVTDIIEKGECTSPDTVEAFLIS